MYVMDLEKALVAFIGNTSNLFFWKLLYKSLKSNYNNNKEKILSIIKENIKDDNKIFVFPTEIATDLWLDKYIIDVFENELPSIKIIIPGIKPTIGIKVSDKKEKQNEIKNADIIILIVHL